MYIVFLSNTLLEINSKNMLAKCDPFLFGAISAYSQGKEVRWFVLGRLRFFLDELLFFSENLHGLSSQLFQHLPKLIWAKRSPGVLMINKVIKKQHQSF